ncbi:MAG: hypothetical protein AB7O26_19000, partial [Planctomycetaceae bacterium]
DAAEMQQLRPREVQLHVSNDRGVRWQHLLSADPGAGKFDFEAPNDGEYWFAVKTLDGQNRLFPRENTEPGLKVIIDTTRPTLELRLREIERGKVQLTWYADDAHLDPTTLRLEYMQPGSNSWQQVSIVPQASGQTAWSVPRGGFVAVRGTVGDSAQNIVQSESQVNVNNSISGAPSSDDEEGPEEYREPVADSKRENEPFGPLPGFEQTAPDPHRQRDSGSPAVSANPNGTPRAASTQRPSAGTGGKFISDLPESRPQVLQQRRPNTAGESQPGHAPSSLSRHFVNNRSFQVGYRIDGAELSTIAAVELYITENDGREWFRYGEDGDRQSPFPVQVLKDGVYGFRLRVRSAIGPSVDPPKPGEKPTIVVTVDQTPPVAQLLPVQPAPGAAQSEMVIRWDVRDEHLGPTPIALSIAASPAGPWMQLGGWQPNSGQYLWKPEPGVPATAFVRLTAKDAAGNVTEIAGREAVVVSHGRPSVRIIGVEPRSGAATKQ